MTQQQINNQHTEIAVQKTFERHLQSRIRHIQINITPHRKYKNSLPLQKYKKQTYKSIRIDALLPRSFRSTRRRICNFASVIEIGCSVIYGKQCFLMLLADYCIEFKDGHFSASNRKGNFPLSFEFLFCLFFHSRYKLNLGDNNKAAGIIACGFIIEVSCNFSNLLDNQLLRRIAEHDGVNALRQIAELYSQSLDTSSHDILFELASLNIEQIHRRLFFQALNFQYCISIRRIRIQRNLDCVRNNFVQ